MAQSRLERSSQELQTTFEELLGSREVYYNPPASVHMRYPAIVFTRSRINGSYANNVVYGQTLVYEVTVITKDPDALIVEKISQLPRCSHNRSFISDNLYHNVFTLHK